MVDFGCGPGFLLQFCGEWFPGTRRVGIDLDPAVLAYARRHVSGASFVRASASRQALPVADGCVEIVAALHILEHLEDPDRFLRDARRVLVRGGRLMIATPNPAGLGARLAGKKWMGLREDHISLRPPGAWRGAVERAGFRILREGTTGLSGVPVIRRKPLALVHWVPLFLWGYFPWRLGEAYICVAEAA
jgi:SAM-dependent methyltransferase